MDDIAEHIYDEKDEDMVFVTPRQLHVLYEQARQNGWVAADN